MSKQKKEQKFEFQSEVKKLLDILVYSLYQHKEVFLRELISNSADALSKVRFHSLTNQEMANPDEELRIDIFLNEKAQTLVIEDTGVGMTKDELINNLGTIAHSGTLDFLKEMAKGEKSSTDDLIGQFGVGFYASFMVAQEIRVSTRSYKPEESAWLWVSKGDASYTIDETVKKKRGTRIELILKDEEKGLLKKDQIEQIIKTHSRFIPFPIYVEGSKIERVEAIWSQPKSELKEQDYLDFYKSMPVIDSEPSTYLHLNVDAPVQFQALLYVPQTNIDLLGWSQTEPGVDLYSKKVLIQTGSKEIFPEYLRFVKGVVDSEEIPLNISRETFQSHGAVKKIQAYLVKKLLEHLVQVKRESRDKFQKIWEQFGRFFKEGVIKDWESREKIAKLLLFESSTLKEKELIDLDEYLLLNEGKLEKIYYICGAQRTILDGNPAMEAFREQNLPVLMLTEPIDEFVVDHLHEYQKKPFVNILGADVKVDRPKKADQTTPPKTVDISGLTGYLKPLFAQKLADVRLSDRLVSSPCMLVRDAHAPSVQMEKMLKMSDKNYQFQKPILEINPENELIMRLSDLHKQDPANQRLKIISQTLVDLALLKEGLLESVDEAMPGVLQLMNWASAENDRAQG